ncbi:MAG: hypothetical protein HKN20_00840 [Gemmatimonadetes bacterium]|nr:hypothetical protein [Gemmatimonadota bacterium]
MFFRDGMRRLAPAALGFALVVSGCGDDDNPSSPDPGEGDVAIAFDARVDDQAFMMNQMLYTNESNNDYAVKKLQFIVSDFTLHAKVSTKSAHDDENDFTSAAVHYRDLADAATRTLTLTDVPAGEYDFVSFTFGLDEEDNLDPDQGGTLPQTDDYEAMRWPASWGGGYHYMKCEGDFVDANGDTVTFATHTGKRHAIDDGTFGTDAAPSHHFFEVTVPIDLEVTDGGTEDLTLHMNVNEWFRDPAVYDLDVYPRMVMMNLAAQAILMGNGADVFDPAP